MSDPFAVLFGARDRWAWFWLPPGERLERTATFVLTSYGPMRADDAEIAEGVRGL